MIGGVSGITRDVIPFGFAFGPRADLVGLNVVGLKRRGHSREEIHRVRRAYRDLFEGTGPFEQRVKSVTAEFAGDALVGKIVAFIQASGSRPVMKTATGGGSVDGAMS
jgi:UDP-N-acetylglucosamine acyltransferase